MFPQRILRAIRVARCPRTVRERCGRGGHLIRAAALHRSEAAFDWLIHIIEQESRKHAGEAAEALAVYERNTKLTERVQAAIAGRRDSGPP